MANKPVTEIEYNLIIAYMRSGMNIKTAASLIGCTEDTVSKYWHLYEAMIDNGSRGTFRDALAFRKSAAGITAVGADDVEQIIRMRKEGATIFQISMRTGINARSVMYHIRKNDPYHRLLHNRLNENGAMPTKSEEAWIVKPEYCKGCIYFGKLGSTDCCDYTFLTGHARHEMPSVCTRKKMKSRRGRTEDK